ncbi:DUF6221 family protein [Streptomyces griseosporeus]
MSEELTLAGLFYRASNGWDYFNLAIPPEDAITDPHERELCRAMLLRALALLGASEKAQLDHVMPDLYGWIQEQITAVENAVRAADKEHGRDWTPTWDARTDSFQILDSSGVPVADGVQPGTAGLIAANAPRLVLLRCAADRKQLKLHAPQPDGTGFPDGFQCRTCSEDGGDGYQYLVPFPCPTIRAVAEGYGWVEKH